MHIGERVCQTTSNCCDKVAVGEGGFDDGATHMACGAEDLRISFLVGVGIRSKCIRTAMVDSRPILAASRGFEDPVGHSSRGVEALS